MKRQLREEKLLETVRKIREQIDKRFAGSGLSRVAAEVVQTTEEALVRAEAISRPNYWLRAGLILLAVIAVGGVVAYTQDGARPATLWQQVLEFLNDVKGSAAILAATAVFLFTLETRLKRRRALKAVHELRALAHIIDMHQLAKDPARISDPTRPVEVEGRTLSTDELGRYLHYCTELLAVISKIGQLYVQDFPDSVAVTAVDNFEGLATGLSSKIWQKLMILERVRSEGDSRPSEAPPAAARTAPQPPAVVAP
jgi:hypothetical protein